MREVPNDVAESIIRCSLAFDEIRSVIEININKNYNYNYVEEFFVGSHYERFKWFKYFEPINFVARNIQHFGINTKLHPVFEQLSISHP